MVTGKKYLPLAAQFEILKNGIWGEILLITPLFRNVKLSFFVFIVFFARCYICEIYLRVTFHTPLEI